MQDGDRGATRYFWRAMLLFALVDANLIALVWLFCRKKGWL